MSSWTDLPEAAALLASLREHPPRQRLVVYRFQETGLRFTGRRVRRLARIYRMAQPQIDTPQWRDWLRTAPQQVIAQTLRHRAGSAHTLTCRRSAGTAG